LTARKYFWVGRTEDVEYVSADAVRSQKIKGLITDLQVELGKAVKIMQDFFSELQTYEFEDEVVGNLPLERSFPTGEISPIGGVFSSNIDSATAVQHDIEKANDYR